jgi:hypothetical protein
MIFIITLMTGLMGFSEVFEALCFDVFGGFLVGFQSFRVFLITLEGFLKSS